MHCKLKCKQTFCVQICLYYLCQNTVRLQHGQHYWAQYHFIIAIELYSKGNFGFVSHFLVNPSLQDANIIFNGQKVSQLKICVCIMCRLSKMPPAMMMQGIMLGIFRFYVVHQGGRQWLLWWGQGLTMIFQEPIQKLFHYHFVF